MTGLDTLKVGVRRRDSGYEGVLRRGSKVVFACGHRHNNRDISTGVNGTSALDCVEVRVRSVRNDRVAKEWQATLRGNAQRAARLIAVGSTDTMRMLNQAEEAIGAFKAAVVDLAELIGGEPVYGGGNSLVITPPPPVGICPRCGVKVTPNSWYGPTPPTPDWAERNHGRAWSPWGNWRSAAYTNAAGYVWCENSLDHAAPEDLS